MSSSYNRNEFYCQSCGEHVIAYGTHMCSSRIRELKLTEQDHGSKKALVATSPLMLVRVWEAFKEIDNTGGKVTAQRVSLGLFFQKAVAEEAARGKGMMGSDGMVLEVWMATTDGKLGYRVMSKDPIKPAESLRTALREQALAKLTAEERDALGLS